MGTAERAVPPSPLSHEPTGGAAGLILPWVTLLYAIPCGAAAQALARLATQAVVLRSGASRVLPMPPAPPPRAVDVVQECLWGALWVGIACLALALADRLAARAARWARWAVALAIVGVLPLSAFVPGLFMSATPVRHMIAFLPAAGASFWTMGLGGLLMGSVARTGSGLLWKLPLAGGGAALTARAAGELLTMAVLSPRAAFVGPWVTGVVLDWVHFASWLLPVAFAAALGLRAARRRATGVP